MIYKNLIQIQYVSKENFSSLYCFQIFINKNDNRIRNKLAYFLEKKKITTTVYYTPAHKHNFYKKKFKSNNLKNTNELFLKSFLNYKRN